VVALVLYVPGNGILRLAFTTDFEPASWPAVELPKQSLSRSGIPSGMQKTGRQT